MGIVLVGMILTFIDGFIIGVIIMTDDNDYKGWR